MSRLIDDVRRIKRVYAPWYIAEHKLSAWTEHMQRVITILRDPSIPVIVIDNVASYYYEATGQETWDLRAHFPNCAPPYPLCWFEHKMPRTIHSDECGDTDVAALVPHGRVGWLIIGADRSDVVGRDIPDAARWLICAEQFVDYGNARGRDVIDGSPGTIMLAIDEHGAVIDRPCCQSYCIPDAEDAVRHAIAWLHPVLLAISFMHCKNVTLVDNAVPRALAKSFASKHGFAPAAHKTLVIEPLKEILRRDGRSDAVGLAKSLHICRGHFSDYREGRGLFGKHHALVWFNSHVRGTRGKSAPPREIEVRV